MMPSKQGRPPKKSRKTPAPRAKEPAEKASPGFPIVGIGASAGGLAAFEAFFSAMPVGTESGMALVLVQHLAPDHKSLLSDLVKRYTRMQVFEVSDGMKVLPGCVYIIPPNRDMALLNGTLQLLEPAASRGLRLPIDFFFRSLAQDQRERAICIVLSGTGSDGALGVREVKGEGGMVMAQKPESTEYDGMPRSAIGTGMVDFVLPPAEMPDYLIRYVAHAFGGPRRPAPPAAAKAEDMLSKVFALLRVQTGHDFSKYKPNTIARRAERRMALQQIATLEDYVRYLRQTPAEVDALFRDLLIGVTKFFRDPEAFKTLEEQAVPRLFAGKAAGSTVRVWVPGCSTGEEAYSIAMLLQERLDSLKTNCRVQVFATDLDRRAIEHARAGVYPPSIAADVPPERLARFFVQQPGGGDFVVHKGLRDLMVFSEQDVIKDPPFSKLDLISCRNLLIYLDAELQEKLIPLFHYALSPGGVLFLGSAETVGEHLDLFGPLDRKAKLYRRKEVLLDPRRPTVGRFLPLSTPGGVVPRRGAGRSGEKKLQLRELTERALLQHRAVVGALVDARGDVLYLHGRSGRYLEPSPGEAGANILKMAREGLRRDLATALHGAATRKETARRPGLRVKTNGDFTEVDLTVRPLGAAGEGLYLVVLEDAPGKTGAPLSRRASVTRGAPNAEEGARVAALEEALRAKDEHLQSTVEELETANEELQSSNEEMQSVNEELQSTNEELETSKEELQSVNEELSTVNTELQTKVNELSRTSNDMSNLMTGMGIATIFVDHQLRIQRFTPAATQLVNLIPTDVGRPVGHIVSNLEGYDRLVGDVKEVLDSLAPKEVEVRSKTGDWFLLRIRPYRTLENVIEGAVITFVDVSELKRIQASLREADSLRRLAVVVRDAYDAITVRDFEGRILEWNPGAVRLYGWSEAEALTLNARDLVPEDLREEAQAVAEKLSRAEAVVPCCTKRLDKSGRAVDVWVTTTVLLDAAGKAYAVATTERAAGSRRGA
ncbi:MAG: chemotaxis protein CheB [Elusimicrobiota bacterium]|jgi:two-component system CheB/CheR fusion protein